MIVIILFLGEAKRCPQPCWSAQTADGWAIFSVVLGRASSSATSLTVNAGSLLGICFEDVLDGKQIMNPLGGSY